MYYVEGVAEKPEDILETVGEIGCQAIMEYEDENTAFHEAYDHGEVEYAYANEFDIFPSKDHPIRATFTIEFGVTFNTLRGKVEVFFTIDPEYSIMGGIEDPNAEFDAWSGDASIEADYPQLIEEWGITEDAVLGAIEKALSKAN